MVEVIQIPDCGCAKTISPLGQRLGCSAMPLQLSGLVALSVDAVFHIPVRLQYCGAFTRASCINGMCGRSSRRVRHAHVRAVCEHSHWTGDSSAEDKMSNPCILSFSYAW